MTTPTSPFAQAPANDSHPDLLPFRMELFSAEQRGERGGMLAQEHRDRGAAETDAAVLRRLDDNARAIETVRRAFVDDVTAKKPVTSVGEWLVDNYYVIEEQASLAGRHLPPKFLKELPGLFGSAEGVWPRVYDLAEHIVAYGDGRVDIEDIEAVVEGYQEVAPLLLGELWAVPIMIRLALVENVRRMALLAEKCRRSREAANAWADALIRTDREDPKNLVVTLGDMARAGIELTDSFVAEFKRRLQGRSGNMKLPLQWVEQSLNETGRGIEQAVAEENHIQAVLEISMRNTVNSLRSLNVTDWNSFVEKMSVVERTLRRDPACVYGDMDFATRDEYRRAIGRMARKSPMSETDIADKCLELAEAEKRALSPSAVSAHVGYYLMGDGETALKKAVRFRGGLGDRIRDASSRHTLYLYLGSIVFLTLLFTFVTIWLAAAQEVSLAMLYALVVPVAFCAGHLAVGLVNFFATILSHPRTLPRMDYEKGLPEDKRTLVVVPVIIGGRAGVKRMLRTLEMHFLNNKDDNVHYGLLTDFPDAPEKDMPFDAEVLDLCVKGIKKLNEKYPDAGGDNFFLFHRPRAWNEIEKIWMGYERKRGKLEDLNRFLADGDSTPFSRLVGRTEKLAGVKYVITLDADTVMPRDAAWQMVGSMAHPLNRPVYDDKAGRVVRGHGILQPRVDSCLSGATRTPYARMCAGEIGIDPYTRASSDVYQDLFDEGSFIGKGIYEVATFNRALGKRFPDNKILSHDLIEGCVVRSGLLNDVKLYEDPPTSYLMDIFRRHRWVRGDWQIASYLMAGETRRGFRETAHPLNLLSQWKVFDNLRRSLTPIFVLLLLVLGLVALTTPWLYLVIVCGVFAIPVIINAFSSLVRKSPDKTFRQHLTNLARSTWRQAVQAVFKFSCLPYESYVNADAIIRSLWRQCVSRRLLLQWNPSDNTHKESLSRFWPILGRMWIGPVAALAVAAALLAKNHAIFPYALPLLALWFISPLTVSWFSSPPVDKKEELGTRQKDFLRKAARRVWLFFEDFVNADENWLPPDNYQEYPAPKTAHRTSPTNMGLSLLANLSAYDFGFLTGDGLLRRCGYALATMRRLERFRGHFYNWYDTVTLRVMKPAYVSTVDSGNLAAHLLVLAAGMRSLPADPIVGKDVFRGLLDALELAIGEAENPGHPQILALEKLRPDVARCVRESSESLADIHESFRRIGGAIADVAAGWPDDGVELKSRRWLRACDELCRAVLGELERFCPWAPLLAERPEWAEFEELTRMPTLLSLRKDADRRSQKGAVALPAEAAALLEAAAERAGERLQEIQDNIVCCEDLANIEYDFLYDEKKRLLTIGYNVDDRRADQSYYDLLASEARLAVYLGVVQNKLPQASWFALSRTLTMAEGRPLLISWSGTMFEYLMPLLIMPSYQDTLLNETYGAVVAVQSAYGKDKGVPWGISESGYNVLDAANNYQYRAFGVPDLGLKHGLSEDLVVAPYAAALAVMVAPAQATADLERLDREGCQTSYGFYEAIDYTPSRLPQGKERAIVRSYMAHHQAMSMIAIGQALLDRPMHRRFEADPRMQSSIMLLQEMVPDEKALYYHSTYSPETHVDDVKEDAPVRVLGNPNAPRPEVQLLSNGRYHVMVTAAGGGYTRWKDFALTRWREDATRDNWGSFCYIRDRDSGDVWSNTYQPTLGPARKFEAIFAEGKAEFNRRDGDFDTHTEIVVSPEDDVEIRRVRLTNRTGKTRRLHLTSFAEVALAHPAADDSHQSFSKLFVQSEIVESRQALVFSRRPRQAEEKNPLMFHLLAVRGSEGGDVSYETDRLAFLGRGRDATRPQAVYGRDAALAGGNGAVLDPVMAIRTEIRVGAGESVTVDLVTGVAEERATLETLMEKYQDQRMADKAIDMAWTHGQLLLRQLNIGETEAQTYCRLASAVLYADPALRANASVIERNRGAQSGLWGYSISGDLPIILLRIGDPARLHLVEQLLRAHNYWRQKGLAVDLAIWNEDQSGYRQDLHDQIVGMAGMAMEDGNLERPGGIFIRAAERIAEDDRVLIQAVARVVLSDGGGMLEEQLHRLTRNEMTSSTTMVHHRHEEAAVHKPTRLPAEELELANGFGGFSKDGREYIIHTAGDRRTPLPWVNVLANPGFGSVVSEGGSAYTWSENAHEFRLTPWQNDPVSDSSGEALYLRDEETGEYWSPTPLPCPDGGDYVVRHGFGYSAFEHRGRGVFSTTTVFVDRDESVKYTILKLKNESDKPRTLSVTAYAEWVLGDIRAKTAMHVVTWTDQASGALFAANRYNGEFPGRTAFLDVDDSGRTLCGDRSEFLGRNGSIARPFALQRSHLSGRVGAGLDPCGAVQMQVSLAPGRERTLVLRMGVGMDLEDAQRLVHAKRGTGEAFEALKKVRERWTGLLETVQVETPDSAFNIMANGWLLYQALACRFWGRSATYQSGGAFGFRDQLQDCMAFLHAEPDLARRHILLSAAHQFLEGDAMHWWHPPVGRGVRTRCSDDYLWLPFVAERYVSVTGDQTIWDEEVPYLEGRPLRDDEESYYDLPGRSEKAASLYEHCRQSIRHGLRFGRHGLPLIGSGDWNDGMDQVGIGGEGESVWLGFFLYSVLTGFAGVAGARDDGEFAEHCRREAEQLRQNIEANAWDDTWYRRAYFDDGTPLGSAANDECRIDSIAQSWSVLSGAGDPERAGKAMHSLDAMLVDREAMIVKLFTPPFDRSEMNPGYIKGYVPGVRENGGQYTHAAIWAGMAFARLGWADKAWELHSIINPANHALDAAAAEIYKAEPYVVAADVYAAADHAGRGGWTWYTGSASWLYRFMLESILGLEVKAGVATLNPCVPPEWSGFKVRYRFGRTRYELVAKATSSSDDSRLLPKGAPETRRELKLVDDGEEHMLVFEY